MNHFMRLLSVIIVLLFVGCKSSDIKTMPTANVVTYNADYTIAFGSCNKQNVTNLLWAPILEHQPSVWIWGGDNVYSDTDNMVKLKADYDKQLSDPNYQKLIASAKILGTWDDHDYGLSDGGEAFYKKKESQEEFLDFMGVSKTDARRNREGVYDSETINLDKGSIKIIVLDTRYFRSELTEDKASEKRYKPNEYGKGTVLGTAQWKWLEDELKTSDADFNIIVSSIQLLSNEHGFETWGNFPHEVARLESLIVDSKAKGVLILSGDRHISEFSSTDVEGLAYPLVDFTSSGLTHAYSKFSGESNAYRIGSVISEISFGVLHFNFETKEIEMEMRGENNIKLNELSQKY
ncbi:alkaline phosphatase family protein [Winogradskyella undariae]|uniref:alkaline phosphatase D family protein n=1 Tax=Winogradskyella undariae TaxID=1285465 RepID=UPI00156AE940|nr:alkaline phosphatase D family protein [Winogradskyella undariae]NRR91896.1 alkaline phosphatase family protein [Winogradskyella undariae]